eukprot:CAMPEP_0115436448 /NCGR_PEP_ID=MMETSP0271-20121206/34206_1 /TAXON_ID=71861 /ORGANISM="Scrippsiella trochoidea, Strain CCMP3099" /LENGTH=113 /DNA_ID=CAMNT_0002861989 /DNA_START=643 /DNA_END=984 /DNA_ORIENTATION=+
MFSNRSVVRSSPPEGSVEGWSSALPPSASSPLCSSATAGSRSAAEEAEAKAAAEEAAEAAAAAEGSSAAAAARRRHLGAVERDLVGAPGEVRVRQHPAAAPRLLARTLRVLKL